MIWTTIILMGLLLAGTAIGAERWVVEPAPRPGRLS
jgi:hypothetical protein